MISSQQKVKIALGFLVAGILSLYLLKDFSLNLSSSGLVVLGLIVVLLEAASPRLDNWGYQSCSIGVCAVIALLPGMGTGISLLILLNSLILRTVFRGTSHKLGFAADVLSDLLPSVLFLASLKMLLEFKGVWFLCALLYAVCTVFLPQALDSQVPSHVGHSKKAMAPFLAGMAVLGLYWSTEPSHLLAGGFLYAMMVYGVWELSRTRTLSREELAETHLGLVREHQIALYQELEEKSEFARYQERNRRLLETIQKNFAEAKGFKQPLSALLKLLEGLFKSRSAIFFLCTEARPRPYLFRSPDQSLLEGAELAGLTEPLVITCWRENRPYSRRKRAWPEKLLPEERSVAVAPVPGYGVLYLGHTDRLFDGSVLETLSLVGRQASYLMQGLTERVAQQQKLAYVSDEKRRLSLWLNRLEQLLDVSQKLGKCSSPKEAYATLETCLGEAVPHQNLVIADGSNQPILHADAAKWKVDSVVRLVHQVARNGKAVIFNSIPEAALKPLEEATSLLIVPMNRLRRAMILVESQSSGAFTQEHLDLCRMIVELAESALLRMKLQEEYISASKDAAIGQMAAGLSHELNTPMGVIQLEVERAQMAIGKSPEKVERHLDRAEAALDTSQKILSALLYYTTSYAVTHEDLNLKIVLEELLEQIDSPVPKLLTKGDNFEIKAFRLDLEQMLKQLIFNAIEATANEAEPRVEVRLQDAGPQLIVEVRDNGAGVPQELRERIFEPFFTTKPVGRGLGLGLSVASQIARLHEGSLTLVPSTEKGATFSLQLPRDASS